MNELKDKKRESIEHAKAFAETIAAQRAYKAYIAKAKAEWQAEIAEAERRAMEKVNEDVHFKLCKKCVVERTVETDIQPILPSPFKTSYAYN